MSRDEDDTVPCGTCGEPTRMTGTKRCDACWEIESRLQGYLVRGGARARDFVNTALMFYESTVSR